MTVTYIVGEDHLSFRPDTYFPRAFDDPRDLALRMQDETQGHTYDTLVGTGLSGALVVPCLGRLLNLNWCIVRRSGHSRHADAHNQRAEGTLGQRWLFVDDFTISGATERYVRQTVRELSEPVGFLTVYVGAYLYQRNEFYRNEGNV